MRLPCPCLHSLYPATPDALRLPATATPLGIPCQATNFVVEQWQADLAPAGRPSDVVGRLNAEINKALESDNIVALAIRLGVTLVGGTPRQLGVMQKADSAKWAKVIRDGNIKLE